MSYAVEVINIDNPAVADRRKTPVRSSELTVRQGPADGIDCTWTLWRRGSFRDALLSAPEPIISAVHAPVLLWHVGISIAAAGTPDIPFVFVSGTLGDT